MNLCLRRDRWIAWIYLQAWRWWTKSTRTVFERKRVLVFNKYHSVKILIVKITLSSTDIILSIINFILTRILSLNDHTLIAALRQCWTVLICQKNDFWLVGCPINGVEGGKLKSSSCYILCLQFSFDEWLRV